MKEKVIYHRFTRDCRILLTLCLLVGLMTIPSVLTFAQSVEDSSKADAATAVKTRIERARSLAAAHQLAAAASELEAIRASVDDEVMRSVTSVMLMNIYLEEGTYPRAESLLEETFQARKKAKNGSIRTYFALAGQAVNGARAHLARYRHFGINISRQDLPAEATGDLDRLRSLLERMIAQAKEISSDASKAYDSLALLEDVVGIRLSLARDSEDRVRWEDEYTSARQSLANSQTQIASLGGMPPLLSPGRTAALAREKSARPTAETAEPKSHEARGAQPAGGNIPSQTNGEKVDQHSELGAADQSGTITAGFLNQRATRQVTPSYPDLARKSGVQGVVRVYVAVDEAGKVSTVFKSDGHILLRKSAESAARQWKFPPTVIAGKALKLTGYIEFNFRQ